ncbi:MAG: helix-turn-helix transcriptional regulator [Halobacteriovoraceae bacterium]|nr:helix-turn-helix transcriptional regulator [Halobacteriovoraceae bacterium]
MKFKKKKYRRSDKKIETREGRLLAYLRDSRGLSMRKAASIIGVSCSQVNHVENGRMDLTNGLILKFLNAYGYEYEEFVKMLEGKIEIPEHLRIECIEIIKRLDHQKLKSVKAFLKTFLQY